MLLIAVLVLVVLIAPASAIVYGELDGDAHPHVVLLAVDVDDEYAWHCSATMLAPTVVLTAGHCTALLPGDEGEAVTGMRIFTESDVENGDNNFPYAGANSIEAAAWYNHPDFEPALYWQNDVSVVILEEPFEPGVYGQLPQVDQLDGLKTRRGLQKTTFTAVGYGDQWCNPVFVEEEIVRMYAEPRLIQINAPGFTGDFSLLLSNNHATGGTCSGDSGGPNFLGDSNVVAAVTSYGQNYNCAGTGGVFRMDRQNVLDFVEPFLSP
ncbi:MAG: trypsin-like serine protease [Anaerolineae bacterium]|nr:trypsin-like serine protease [Anaerolineae bacterium]